MEYDLETKIIKDYHNYIMNKSIFANTLKILPEAPQSFATFPTIIISEINNSQNIGSTSTNYMEHADNLGYRVTIYSKNSTVGNVKYQARNVRKELQLLTFNYFMNLGFVRASGTKGEYPDISIDRYDMVFTATKNNWNGQIR